MTEQCTIKKNEQHPADALWWRPFFSIQRKFNHQMMEAFSPLRIFPSFVMPSPSDIEEDMLFSVQRRTHRLFSELFNNRQMLTPWCTGANTEPYVNIIENGNKFKIKADVPGLKAKDLEVSISDCAITIKGKKCDEKTEEGDNYIRKECHSGSFSRTIALPEEADVEKVSAIFEDNVLKIEIPKKAVSKSNSRNIAIGSDSEKLPSFPLKFSSIKPEEKPTSDQDNFAKDKKPKVA